MDPKNRFNIGYYGSGQQWFPWIHFADAADIVAAAVKDERYQGVINAVAPGLIRQKDIARAMRKMCTDRNSWFLPAPKFVAEWKHRERAFQVLESRKVLPSQKLENFDFVWRYPTIDKAIGDLWDAYKDYEILPMPLTPGELT